MKKHDSRRPGKGRWLAILGLAVLWLAPVAGAQTVRFDPLRHLDGYADVLISEYHDLYRLREFEQYEGHVLTDARLDQLRRAWRVERERVAAQLDHFRRHPEAYVLYRLERAMLVHPYFSRIQTKTFESHDPFVFLLEPPRTSRKGYDEMVVRAFGKALLEVRGLFEKDVVEPLGLERREGFAAFPVIVLAGSDEYRRYLRTLEAPALFFAQAHYDPKLRAVITYLEPRDDPGANPGLIRPVAHEIVHALRHAYSDPDRRPEPWIDEGLASYLSSQVIEGVHEGMPSDRLAVQALLETCADAGERATYLLDALELVGLWTYGQAYESMLLRASAEGLAAPDYQKALLALFGQAGIWAWYLNEADGGAQAGRFRAYLGASLHGRGGVGAFRQAFEGVTMEDLDARFQAFLTGSLDAWSEAVQPDRKVLEATFLLSDTVEAELRREVEERVDTLEALAPDHADPTIRYVTALRKASRGRFAAAAQEMQMILAYREESPFTARCRRELSRLNAFREERRRFLESLRDSGKKLNLAIGDRRLLATVLAVEETHVLLGRNKLGLDELELDAMDPLQLVKRMRKQKGFARSWIQAYPHVLLDTDRWESLLSGETSEGAVALLEDARRGDYREALRRSDAVETLVSLSTGGMPDDVASARRVLEAVRRLQDEFVDLDLVRVRRQPIIRIAYRAQSLLFDVEGLGDVIRGDVEDLGDGVYRLTYGFDDPAQGGDFTPERYLDAQRWKGSPTAQSSVDFHVADGALVGIGAICTRHELEFEGPQRVLMRYVFRTPEGAFDDRIRAVVGICDDGNESYVTCDMLGGITVADRDTSYLEEVQAQNQVYMDTEHEIEITHDGANRIRTSFDGQPAAEANCGPRLGGGLFLWANSEAPFEVVELVIEGRVSPASLRLLRTSWTEAKLADLGLR